MGSVELKSFAREVSAEPWPGSAASSEVPQPPGIPPRPALTTLGGNQDRERCVCIAPSVGRKNEGSDRAAESKAGPQQPCLLRTRSTGGPRGGAPSLRGCLPECVGRNVENTEYRTAARQKPRDRPAAGEDTHLSRTRAGRSGLRENAEAGENYDSQKSTRPQLPVVRAADSPKSGQTSEELGLQLPASLAGTSRAPPLDPRMLRAGPAAVPSAIVLECSIPGPKRDPGS